MRTILHLSDIHTTFKADNEEGATAHSRFQTIVNSILKEPKLKPHGVPSIIAITGDLMDDFSTDTLTEVARLVKVLRDADHPVFVIPGNHDYRVGKEIAPKADTFWSKLVRFDHSQVEWLTEMPKTKAKYPYAALVDNDLAVIGMDSMAERIGKKYPWTAVGEFGSAQMQTLEELLLSPKIKNAKRRLLLMHHDPFHDSPLKEIIMRLVKDEQKKLKLLLQKHAVDLLLCGHLHEAIVYNRKSILKEDTSSLLGMCIEGGTSTRFKLPESELGSSERPGPHRLLNIDPPSISIPDLKLLEA